jgi:hypothetical protein
MYVQYIMMDKQRKSSHGLRMPKKTKNSRYIHIKIEIS